MTGRGLPEPLAGLVLSFYAGIATGRHALVTDDLPQVLGRPARTFAAFARESAALWKTAGGVVA